MAKYDVTGLQGIYQLDSNNLVLANKLSITEVADMDEAELVLLAKLYGCRSFGTTSFINKFNH